jgi:hypothetical protein
VHPVQAVIIINENYPAAWLYRACHLPDSIIRSLKMLEHKAAMDNIKASFLPGT